jgi:hypothetical protein
MAAVVSDAGLALMAAQILGQNPQENLMLQLFNDGSLVNPAAPLGDFPNTPLPGGGPQLLVASAWANGSISGKGDFTYAIVTFTLGPSVSGDTIYGYVVYSGTTNTVLWYDFFPLPQVLPPTGGNVYINLEFTDVNSP